MNSFTRDRYTTFEGLSCDVNASKVVAFISHHISEPGNWADYFSAKFAEQKRLAVDDLFFVGSQMNNIHDFFTERGDEEALALLYQVEQECC